MLSTSSVLLASGICFALTRSVIAADCFGDKGKNPNIEWVWDLREAMCGPDSECSAQGSNECTLILPFANGTWATAYKSSQSGQYTHCWDAYENAINQCFDDESVQYSGSEGKTQGNWGLDGESYWINIVSSEMLALPIDPAQEALVDTVDEDPDTPGGDYVWGPTNYCIGLSPGGGDTCIDVPDGCYIISAMDNTIPNDPVCG